MISIKKQLAYFFVWMVIVPPGFLLAYNYFPSGELDWVNIAILFAILFMTMLMPLRLQSVTISLEFWVTLTIFLQYGVFVEMVFMQLAMCILLFSGKSTLPVLYRFFVNSSIFTVTSIVSGTVFYFAGGTIGSIDFSKVLLFGSIYAIVYTLVNNVLLKAYFKVNSLTYSLRTKEALWDYVATLMMLPFSISLYFLHENFNNKAILLVGIPFVFVLLVIRLYNNSNTLNDKLEFAGNVGHELADQLRFDEVIQTFIEKLKDVVPYDQAYVIDVRSGNVLFPLMSSENGVISKDVKGISFNTKKIDDDGLDSEFSKIFYNRKETRALKNINFSHPIESVMTTPIIRNYKTEGYLILTSNRKNVFQTVEMKIVDILAGYFSISLEKARYFEKTVEKSVRCGLTNLHNFRYLDMKLNEEIIRYHTGEIKSLSAIIIDIDHFKAINDTYGHQSGNDLLNALARLLEAYDQEGITLARYGGEEFVMLIPDIDKKEATALAEDIRKEVEQSTFRIIPDLSENREPSLVQLTISIGIANVPEDARDAKDLIRNADRALYIGGKQAGRNRVGIYGDEVITTV